MSEIKTSNMNTKGAIPNATIAFTLPVSCQICLGKVKQPVVCPNQHVFCGPCMELWLQRNQQCPACRVYITEENPCRKVLGGLNPETAATENFCQKELRRARMELIYKDYENEIDRLEAELEAVKQDNSELRNFIHGNRNLKGPSPPVSTAMTEQDRSMISLLNTKLKDAMHLYEKVQKDLDKYRKENSVLRDKNIDLERENQTLRLELTNRSPRRFGRFTVATLESKLEQSEKQITKLQKALERSDEYIDDLEKQLQHYRDQASRKSGPSDDQVRGHHKVISNDLDLSKTDSNLNDSELPSRISNISEPISEIVSDIRFDDSDISLKPTVHRNEEAQSSFDLDVPSPVSKSSKQCTDTDFTEDSHGQDTDDTFVLPKPSASRSKDPTLDSCKKKLRFTFSADQGFCDDLVKGHHQLPPENNGTKAKVRFSMDKEDLGQNSPDLNVSMTPDLEDCFRIMDEAKRKLEERQQPILLTSSSGITSTYVSLANAVTSAPLVTEHQGLLYPRSTQSVASVLPTSVNQCKPAASESFATNLQILGKPFPPQYPQMQNTSHDLGSKSEMLTAASQSQNGLFTVPHISQSSSLTHVPMSQGSLLANNGLLTSSVSVHQSGLMAGLTSSGPPFSNKTSTSCPSAVSHLHTLGGSTLSQPTPSLHQQLGINPSTFQSSKSSLPSFPHFSISQ